MCVRARIVCIVHHARNEDDIVPPEGGEQKWAFGSRLQGRRSPRLPLKTRTRRDFAHRGIANAATVIISSAHEAPTVCARVSSCKFTRDNAPVSMVSRNATPPPRIFARNGWSSSQKFVHRNGRISRSFLNPQSAPKPGIPRPSLRSALLTSALRVPLRRNKQPYIR